MTSLTDFKVKGPLHKWALPNKWMNSGKLLAFTHSFGCSGVHLGASHCSAHPRCPSTKAPLSKWPTAGRSSLTLCNAIQWSIDGEPEGKYSQSLRQIQISRVASFPYSDRFPNKRIKNGIPLPTIKRCKSPFSCCWKTSSCPNAFMHVKEPLHQILKHTCATE